MKTLMTTFAILLTTLSGHGSAAPAKGPIIPPVLKCGEKLPVNEECFILDYNVPVRIAENTLLTYVDLKDSRCPLDVVCVWAGFVVAGFVVESMVDPNDVQSFALSPMDPMHRTPNYWADESSGLTVIMKDVTARVVSMPTKDKPQVKVNVGFNLR